MARHLATVQRISKLEPIPNADTLEVASILGWKSVVRKGEFKEGDLCTYFEVDSFLPIRPEFEFLRRSCLKKTDFGEGFRIKTIRLRGQVSQGLVWNTAILTKEHKEGDDISEELNIKQYNPPIPACLKGKVKGHFPSFIQKTDETRVQLLQNVLTRHKGKQCYVTEKVDGTSVTYYIKDGVFGVCSRNLEYLDGDDAYWTLAKEFDIENKLKAFGGNIAIQGEIIGTGIQCNPLKLDKKTVLFFNAFEIDKYSYFSFRGFQDVMRNLGLPTVPLITKEFELTDDINELIKFATRKSIVNPNVWAEGIVIRPLIEEMDLQMAQGFGSGRVSFKAVNPEYLIEVEQ